jgi:hypothetical protein
MTTMKRVPFYQVVDYDEDEEMVVCMFDTERFGYLQVGIDDGGIKQFSSEPSLFMFTDKEQEYIKSVLHIVWRMLFDP